MVHTPDSALNSVIIAHPDEEKTDGKESAHHFIERTLYDIIESIVRCRSMTSVEDSGNQSEMADVPNGAGAAGRAQVLPAPVGPRKSDARDAKRQPKGTAAAAPASAASAAPTNTVAAAVTMLLGGEMYAWEAGDAIFLVDGPTAPCPHSFRPLGPPQPSPPPSQPMAKAAAPHALPPAPAQGSWAAVAGLRPRRGSVGSGPGDAASGTAFGSGFRFDVGAVTAPLLAMGK
jgi:hypothetical protein